jgi:hypothetical protein
MVSGELLQKCGQGLSTSDLDWCNQEAGWVLVAASDSASMRLTKDIK